MIDALPRQETLQRVFIWTQQTENYLNTDRSDHLYQAQCCLQNSIRSPMAFAFAEAKAEKT
jgi:hypothetical protein